VLPDTGEIALSRWQGEYYTGLHGEKKLKYGIVIELFISNLPFFNTILKW